MTSENQLEHLAPCEFCDGAHVDPEDCPYQPLSAFTVEIRVGVVATDPNEARKKVDALCHRLGLTNADGNRSGRKTPYRFLHVDNYPELEHRDFNVDGSGEEFPNYLR